MEQKNPDNVVKFRCIMNPKIEHKIELSKNRKGFVGKILDSFYGKNNPDDMGLGGE